MGFALIFIITIYVVAEILSIASVGKFSDSPQQNFISSSEILSLGKIIVISGQNLAVTHHVVYCVQHCEELRLHKHGHAQ